VILSIHHSYHSSIQVHKKSFSFFENHHFKCLDVISDRSNATDNNGKEGSELPEFTNIKMFVDFLLMEYQTNRQIEYELERNLMSCTPYRNDFLFSKIRNIYFHIQFYILFLASESNFVGTIMLMIDAIFIIP